MADDSRATGVIDNLGGRLDRWPAKPVPAEAKPGSGTTEVPSPTTPAGDAEADAGGRPAIDDEDRQKFANYLRAGFKPEDAAHHMGLNDAELAELTGKPAPRATAATRLAELQQMRKVDPRRYWAAETQAEELRLIAGQTGEVTKPEGQAGDGEEETEAPPADAIEAELTALKELRRANPKAYWSEENQAREKELLAALGQAKDAAAGEARGQALVDGVLASVEDAKAFDAAFTTTFDALGAESQAAVRDALRGPAPEATKPASEAQVETFAGTGKECASLVKAWGSAARHRFAAASERFDAMINGMSEADADRAEAWFRALPPAAKAAVVKQLAG